MQWRHDLHLAQHASLHSTSRSERQKLTTQANARSGDTSGCPIEGTKRHGTSRDGKTIPIVLQRGYKTRVWDVEGREYLDLQSGSATLNHGHCHPRLIAALATQAAKLTMPSRTWCDEVVPQLQKRLCDTFGYDQALVQTTDGEARETAIRTARRWGCAARRIAHGRARVIVVRGHCWGKRGVSGDGAMDGGFHVVDFDDLEQLDVYARDADSCAVMLEPVQTGTGARVPKPDFLRDAAAICAKRNVLLIADEVHTGLGRTGNLLGIEHEDVRADLVIVGKALGGGMLPVSAVLARGTLALHHDDGEARSAVGGSPLACAVGVAALDVLRDEALCANADAMGRVLRNALSNTRKMPRNVVRVVRGRGLLNALLLHDVLGGGRTANAVSVEMAKNGVLSSTTSGNDGILLAPPLAIRKEEIEQACVVIREALRTVNKLARKK